VAIGNTKYPGALVDESLFTWGSPKKTPQQIHTHLRTRGNRLTGPGWLADAVEHEWATAVIDTTRSKLDKLNEPDFRRQDENWLAIFDNVPGAALEIGKAIQFLRAALVLEPQRPASFSPIFILHSVEILVIDRTSVQRLQMLSLDDA
jgi:hypothetical protein